MFGLLYRNKPAADQAAKEIAEICSKLNPVEIVTPTNLLSAKESWLAKTAHVGVNTEKTFTNPHFEYNEALLSNITKMATPLERARMELDSNINLTSCSIEDSVVFELLSQRIADAKLTIELAASILSKNDDNSKAILQKKYGRLNSSLVVAAYDEVNQKSPKRPFDLPRIITGTEVTALKNKKFNAKEIAYYFGIALAEYGFDDWSCEISDTASAIDVRDRGSSGSQKIIIPARRHVNGIELLKLIGHEIECHLRSSVNSQFLFKKLVHEVSPLYPLIGLLAKSDDETLYEGAAKLSDVIIQGNLTGRCEDAAPTPLYTIAIDQACRGSSFGETAEVICGLASYRHDSADWDASIKKEWNITYRAYRGITDTDSKSYYAFPKDASYFAGYLIAKDMPKVFTDFSSLTFDNILLLQQAGIPLEPHVPFQDIAMQVVFPLL